MVDEVGTVTRWERASLPVPASVSIGKLSTEKLLEMTIAWATREFPAELYLFRNLRVYIEVQMTSKMKLIQNCLYTWFRTRTTNSAPVEVCLVDPRKVKTMFGLSRGTHFLNKKYAVKKMTELMNDDESKVVSSKGPKLDDLADVFWMKAYAESSEVLSPWRRPPDTSPVSGHEKPPEEGRSDEITHQF